MHLDYSAAEYPKTPTRRRQSRRFLLERRLAVQDLTIDLQMLMIDISTGGMRTWSPRQVPTGQPHMFLVRVPSLAPMSLVGEVVHCEKADSPRGGYLIGWRWAVFTRTSRCVHRLIEHVIDAIPQPQPAVAAATDAPLTQH